MFSAYFLTTNRIFTMDDNLCELAERLAELLREQNRKLVLVESCTAGRVSAQLASIPGISNFYCGSFVVYRALSKSSWLGIPEKTLHNPSIGTVGQQTSNLLAHAALTHTPEADLGVAVTGDVGPFAPASTDGLIFLSLVARESARVAMLIQRLSCPPPRDSHDIAARVRRLDEATQGVLSFIIAHLARKERTTPTVTLRHSP